MVAWCGRCRESKGATPRAERPRGCGHGGCSAGSRTGGGSGADAGEGRAQGGRDGQGERDKGARGERELVRLLQPCVPEGWTVRRAMAYEPGHDLRVVDETGNVAPGGWAIEGKRYGSFDVSEVLRGPSARWLDWWRQTLRQAHQVNRAPMLCTRGDRRPWWVWTHEALGGRAVHIELVVDGRTVCGTLLEDVLHEVHSG